MSTLTPTDLRAWKAEARAHDQASAAAYQAGYAAHRTDHRRLMVVGVIVGAFLLFRRLPLLLFVIVALWSVLVVVALWPLVVIAAAVELTVRQHRRWASWPRTGALVATWLVCGALVYLAVVARSPWPLLGIPAAVVGWQVEKSRRIHHDRHPSGRTGPTTRTGPHSPEPEEPFIVPAHGASPVAPYAVTFTAKAEGVESRHYADGHTVTINTRTGQPVGPDPLGRW